MSASHWSMAAILASDWLLDMTHPAYTDIKMGRAGKKERGKILAPKLKAYVRHQDGPGWEEREREDFGAKTKSVCQAPAGSSRTARSVFWIEPFGRCEREGP